MWKAKTNAFTFPAFLKFIIFLESLSYSKFIKRIALRNGSYTLDLFQINHNSCFLEHITVNDE